MSCAMDTNDHIIQFPKCILNVIYVTSIYDYASDTTYKSTFEGMPTHL